MPIWEVNALLSKLSEYLPHILYGADGARAVEEQSQRATGFEDLISQPVNGGVY